MLQVHFETGDLLDVRFAPRPAPLMELGLAVAALQRSDRAVLHGRWRQDRRRRWVRSAAPLLALVPPNGAGPLFLDPLSETFEEGLEAVRRTRPVAVQSELRRVVPAYRPSTPWVRALDGQDREAWQDLVVALTSAAQVLLGADDWRALQRTYAADLAWRARVLTGLGLGAMLAGLYPGARMAGDVLHVPYAGQARVDLGGRGLTLVPSAFWTGQPLVGDDAGRTLLLYPALTQLPAAAPGDREAGHLEALLGRTRAEVLRASGAPTTTGELSRLLGISPASASSHAATLRAAGLVHSSRDGKRVWHVRTPLGDALATDALLPATVRPGPN